VRPELTLLKAAIKEQDYPATSAAQFAAAEDFAAARELMVAHAVAQAPAGKFFPVPAEYKALPRLEGRARVSLTLAPKGGGAATTLVVVVDGYHAPLAAGAFVSQAAAGNLDDTPIAYAEELIVGMARPKDIKAAPLPVPLELFYRGDGEPTYGINQDDDGRGSATQVLPFQAYGALGLSHPDEDIDGGVGGQFFFVKYDQGLMPPGRNTLDGAYTCFGYTVEGSDFLKNAKPGDKIVKAEVLGGLENLRAGQK
jgi:peptidylprolyl isomerase